MAKISKGVIAAAGLNSRFLPASKAVTKGLIPVLEKPVIQYLVEEMIGAGINQIFIVHNHGDPSIKRYFTPDPKLKKALAEKGKSRLIESLEKIQAQAKLEFRPQPRTRLPYGNATPILVAKNFIGDQPFVYDFTDDIIIEDWPGYCLARMIKIFKKYRASVVTAVQEVEKKEVIHYGCVKYANDPKCPHRIEKIIEKPPVDQAPSNMVQDGRFVLSSQIFRVLDKLPIRNNELWLADAIDQLVGKSTVIAEPLKNGVWMTTGDPLRWLAANLAMAKKRSEFKSEIEQFLKLQDF